MLKIKVFKSSFKMAQKKKTYQIRPVNLSQDYTVKSTGKSFFFFFFWVDAVFVRVSSCIVVFVCLCKGLIAQVWYAHSRISAMLSLLFSVCKACFKGTGYCRRVSILCVQMTWLHLECTDVIVSAQFVLDERLFHGRYTLDCFLFRRGKTLKYSKKLNGQW